jgi:hypothetical protein
VTVLVIASPDSFEKALNTARQAESGDDVSGLASRLDAGLLGRLEEAWGGIEAALRRAREGGIEKAQPIVEAAVGNIERLLAETGSEAAEIRKALLRKMQAFSHEITQDALANVPLSIDVHGTIYTLAAVRCSQRLVVTGSLKFNLLELVSLVSQGEIEVSTDYSLALRVGPG